jgi:ATP-dependent DNA ligase
VLGSLLDVVEVIKHDISAQSAIVEGEVIGAAGYPIAFQHLCAGSNATAASAAWQKKIPLTLYLFDILPQR